jgi:hypothetical protein
LELSTSVKQKKISHIQNLSGGYNLNLDKIFRGHNYCQSIILPIILSGQQKCFPDDILHINSGYTLFFCLPEMDN